MACYSKDEIKKRIIVPEIVENEIRNNIEKQLNKAGIFFRVFSRRKTAASLEHKFASNKYGGEDGKKIQDLIGVRVNVYFQDDLSICKRLFEDIFELAEAGWAVNDVSRQNFEAAKINGVFKLPEYLVDKISPDAWDMAIDKTFELQLKTVFFEGWHEVEHDFRYKIDGKDQDDPMNIWNQYSSYSRQFNSIVATLELCDRSIMNMFDNFAYDLYRGRQWEMMIRMHFRIRISDIPLYDGLKEIFEENDCSIGKAIIRTPREELIDALECTYRSVPISVNMIVQLLNGSRLGDNEKIKQIMQQHNVFRDGVQINDTSSERKELLPLLPYNIFANRVFVKSRNREESCKDLFSRNADYIYEWTKEKFNQIFTDMPEHRDIYKKRTYGYELTFVIDEDNMRLDMNAVHVSQNVGGRFWITKASIAADENKSGLWLEVENDMYDCATVTEFERVSRFCYPSLYRDIYSDERQLILDVKPYGDKPFVLSNEARYDELYALINSKERLTPVVVLVSGKLEDGSGKCDESWIGGYWLFNLHRQVKYYAHIYRGEVDSMNAFMARLGAEDCNERGVYVFWPIDKELGYNYYNEDEIANCEHSRYKGEGAGVREDKMQDGAQAFMFRIVDDIKNNIINKE